MARVFYIYYSDTRGLSLADSRGTDTLLTAPPPWARRIERIVRSV